MNFLYGPEGETWVAAHDRMLTKGLEYAKADLCEQVGSVQAWFCDLDDNHAPSVAKDIGYGRVGTSMFDPSFVSWAVVHGAPAWLDKSRETSAWRKYVDRFLQNGRAKRELDEMLAHDRVIDSLFPDVTTFQSMISGERVYVTRNIERVAMAYARALSFGWYAANADDKGQVVDSVLEDNPWINSVGVTGDSCEDGAMIEAAQKRGCNVVSIQTMARPDPRKMDERFGFAVSQNRGGLVNVLRSA